MQYLFPALLTLHLIGLALMGGTVVIEFINYQFFWGLIGSDQQKAAGVLSMTAKISKLSGIGAGLLILSGAGMIAMTHGVMASQVWFKIKMVLVILLILNNGLIGNKTSARIRQLAETQKFDQTTPLQQLRGKLKIFYLLQLVILFGIILLAAYKFN
jgi:uncharacterized membrane protein SirB2